MYSIVYIPTGVTLKEIVTPYAMTSLETEDFYSIVDCKRFIRNFLEYDNFQRRLKGETFHTHWLVRNNRFTYSQYIELFTSLGIRGPLDPEPQELVKEEFTIIKTNRISRTWKITQLTQI